MKVEPYIFFEGRCEEALEFYKKVLGAEVTMLLRYSDSPEPVPAGMVPPGSEQKIMHCGFRIGDSTLNGSDGNCLGKPVFQGFSLTVTVPDVAKCNTVFAALAEGGEVKMPLSKTFFSPQFGMVTDKFGVGWMVIVDAS